MEQVIVVNPNVLASWEQKVKILMEYFVNEKLTLNVYSENGKPNVKIHFEICGIYYGIGDLSLAVQTTCNFKNKHMKIGVIQNNLSMLGDNEIPSCNKHNKK